jgi:hypothetical protein
MRWQITLPLARFPGRGLRFVNLRKREGARQNPKTDEIRDPAACW